MTISPQPAPQHPNRDRTSYNWSAIQVGVWQRWIESTDETLTDEQARQACERIRLAARSYARWHGMTVSTRRLKRGRILDMKFEVAA